MERYKDGEGRGDPNCRTEYVTYDVSPPLKLGKWLKAQRQARKGNGNWKISAERIHRLEELGVWWNKPDNWEAHFAALKRYMDGEGDGDPNCPRKYVSNGTSPPLKLGV